MEPLVISEQLVSRFKFWQDGQVQNGMRHQNELFRCLRVETITGRQRIYDLGWALSHEGVHTIITASKEHYSLWVSLRSLATLESVSNLTTSKSVVNQVLTCSVSA